MEYPPRGSNGLRYPLDDLLGSEGSVRLLRLLANEVEGPVNVPDAAERVGLTAPGARKALARLVETGFVVRVGGGRSQQYALRSDEPLLSVLKELFRTEQTRYETVIRDLRELFVSVSEVYAAWIESAPARVGDPVEVAVVAEAKSVPWLREELRTRLTAVERGFDVIIEVTLSSEANAPQPDPDSIIPLAGVIPQASAVAEARPVPHSERDERALLMSRGIAQLLRQDPSMVKRAMGHLDRLSQENQGTAAGDLYEWRQVLETYSPERLRQFLVSTSSRAARLRQSSPFFAVLTPEERDKLMSYMEKNQ